MKCKHVFNAYQCQNEATSFWFHDSGDKFLYFRCEKHEILTVSQLSILEDGWVSLSAEEALCHLVINE